MRKHGGPRLTEKQVIAALKRLDKGWPPGLTLFSWSGTLCLMRAEDMPIHEGDGRSAGNAIIEKFHGIDNDGGDPD